MTKWKVTENSPRRKKLSESEHETFEEAKQAVRDLMDEYASDTARAGGADCGRSWIPQRKAELETLQPGHFVIERSGGKEGGVYEIHAPKKKGWFW